MVIRAESGQVAAVLLGLFLAGIGYNLLVAWVEQRGYSHGYTAFLVAGGVLITLAGVALISPDAAVIALCAFVASGMPMLVGSVYRYVRDRESEIERMREEARRDHTA